MHLKGDEVIESDEEESNEASEAEVEPVAKV